MSEPISRSRFVCRFVAQSLAEIGFAGAADAKQEHTAWTNELARLQGPATEILEIVQAAQRGKILLTTMECEQVILAERLPFSSQITSGRIAFLRVSDSAKEPSAS